LANFALCIGINKYTSKSVSSLKACENDASAVASILESSPFNYDRVQILSTKSGHDYPSKNNIIQFLKDIAESAFEDDMLFVYYSGHGFRHDDNQYLIPPDGHPNNYDSFIKIIELKEIIKISKAQKKLFIIDACKMGQDLTGLKKIHFYIDPQEVSKVFKDVQGVYMIFSSTKDEVSWEDVEGDHSVFTKFLLKGLRGEEPTAFKNSSLTVESLFEYLSQSVPRYSRTACPSKMTPVFYSVTTAPLFLADFKEIKPAYRKSIYDIYIPVGTPTLTYVAREEEKELLSALKRKGEQVYLYGPSGCGKTCLYEKVLKKHEQKYIMVPCKASFNTLSLNVGIYFKVARKLPEFNPNAHYDIQIAQLTHEAMDRLAEDLAREDVVLILDDFHRLPRDVMREFADTIKTFVLSEAKIFFVGVTNAADQLITIYPDLNERIYGIELKSLSRNQLLKIIELGEEILNIKFDPALSSEIIKQSLRSASLVHDLCLSILEEMGVQKKCNKLLRIEELNLIPNACQKIAKKKSRIYTTIYSVLSYGRRKAKKYATYRMIMEAIASLDDENMRINKDKLYDLLCKRFLDYAPPLTIYSLALSRLRDIQKNLKEVVSYNEISEMIEIVDPGFKFYLNWIVRPTL